jgi:hypothetical protein
MRVKNLPVVPADAPHSDDYTIGSPKDQWLIAIKGQDMNVDKLMEANETILRLRSELKLSREVADGHDEEVRLLEETHKIFMEMEAARINCLVDKVRNLEWQLRNK